MSRSKSNVTVLADIEVLRGIIDALPHPIFVKNEQHRFVMLNQAMCDLMGSPYQNLIGRTDHDFKPTAEADVYVVNDKLVLASGRENENEESFTDGDGGARTIITRKKRADLPDGSKLVVGCISDITEFRRAEAQIRHNAEHDPLTGLANRAVFSDKLGAALRGCGEGRSTAALLLVDLDGFKSVNDALGHAAGDNLLVQTARILSRLAGQDNLACRLGGDEFAVILTTATRKQAESLAAAIIRAISQPMFLGSRQVHIAASVGVAVTLPRIGDCETLMRHADLALYRAKNDGRNTWRMFEPAMEASHLVTRFLEEDLRLALREGQFSLAFQPFADVSDMRVIGFEALLRWNHPTRGPIEPAIFIPLAERTGLIAGLGEWVLREACATAARWWQPLRISVNVSPVQFVQVDMPRLVRSVIEETDIDPRRIDLEITETAVIKDMPGAKGILDALRAIGVHMVLDDFGAGYSSLQMLKQLPFDKIKVDRSLLQDVGSDIRANAMICGILRLSRTLNLRVTAEGIETEEQLAILKREACDELQGFLLGRPAPIATYSRIVAQPQELKTA